MSLTLRPYFDQDGGAVLTIANTAIPYDLDGNERWMRVRQQFDERRFIRRQYVVIDDEMNQIVGYGAIEQQGPGPTRLHLYLMVYPVMLHQGVGEMLYQRLLHNARSLRATSLWMREYQQDTELINFMIARGFVQTQLIWDLRLSLTRTSVVGRLLPTLEEVAARGIVIASLAEERLRDPNLTQRLHELFNTAQADIYQPLPYDLFRQRLESPNTVAQGFFIARDGERLIGLSALERMEGQASQAVQWWTAVLPAYRRQGIATALRLCTIDAAQRQGFQTLITYTEHTDPLMLALNEKLGFRRWFGYVTLEKTLEEPDSFSQ
jgi:GNAT superfamily N-acetyltransferase